MHCPFCSDADTRVIDSRLVAEGDQVRRRRECNACGERFTTFETAELWLPRLVKRDGSRVPFDEEKLRMGMLRALEKGPQHTMATVEFQNPASGIIQKITVVGDGHYGAGEFMQELL